MFSPRLLITVATIVSLASFPFFLNELEIIAIILSPSISLPFSSTAKHLSPSPSYATPMLKLFSTTNFFRPSKCVEPQFWFIFIPSGLLFIILYLIPNDLNTFSATLYVAPFAVSNPTIKSSDTNFSRSSSKFFLKK